MYAYIYTVELGLIRILGKERLVRIPANRPGIPWIVQGFAICSGVQELTPFVQVFSRQNKILIFHKLLL